ncbi:MFS transporter [Azospirillum sp. TSO35-2]|uniref:MFS transporter n=1 Tax=Azospirillum sp. TSO35-2 TaxID=716796 RepID=UPI001304ECEB|nr:MFS transporter [Azospirillum sp. TSO35-2]
MATQDIGKLIDNSNISPYQWRVFLLCALVILLDGIDYQIIGIAAPLIVRDLGFPRSMLGWVFFAGPFGAACGSLLCGLIADRVGRRKTVIGVTALFGLGTLATTLATDVGTLAVLRFVTGLGLGGAVPSVVALTSEYAPLRRRAAIVSALWAAFPLGGTLGGFVNASLIQYGDWRLLFHVWGAVPLLVAGILCFTIPESIRFLLSQGTASNGVGRLVGRMTGSPPASGTMFVSSEPRHQGVQVVGLFASGRIGGTVPLWIVCFVIFGSLTVVAAWSPALLTPLGFTASQTALVVAFNGLGSFIGTSVAGRLIERFGVAACMIPAFALASGSVILFGFAASTTLAPIMMAAAVTGLFMGLASSSCVALSALVYPTSIRSTGIGWAMSCGRLGAVVGPFAIGLMVGADTSVLPIFLSVAVVLLVPIPCLWQLAVYSRRLRLDHGAEGKGGPAPMRAARETP